MTEFEHAESDGASPSRRGWGRTILWGIIVAASLPVVKFASAGFPVKLPEFQEYLRDLGTHVSAEVLLFFAGGVLEELWAVRREMESARIYLARTKRIVPLINKLTGSSLMMNAAGPLLEKTAGIERLTDKKRELACCVLNHSDHTMGVVLDDNHWLNEAQLFENVRNRISTLVPADADGRIVSAYLMSLIAPAKWADRQWADYQERLCGAREMAESRGAKVDFKRIHVLHERDSQTDEGWNNLVNLMIAEAIMGFHVQAMLLQSVRPLVTNPNVGYIADGIHLYDCGVYQGIKSRFVVLADADPYFMVQRESAASLVSEDVALVDILRRNFNLAWRSRMCHSLYDVLKKKPAGAGTNRKISTIAHFLHGGVARDHNTLAAVQKVIADINLNEKEFWNAFDAATENVRPK